MLAIIAGTSLMESPLFSSWDDLSITTPYGEVTVRTDGAHYFIQRHGNPPLPPHRINHRGHLWTLDALKVTGVVAVNSVGSLKRELRPGTFVIPHDFASLWEVPTFFDETMRFMVPEWDIAWSDHLTGQCRDLGMEVTVGAVYVQTRGPRLETKAEIAVLKGYGDVVGMTMASEATLSMEVGIPYASICSVDNYAHGIAEVPLTMDEILESMSKSKQVIETLVTRLVSEGV